MKKIVFFLLVFLGTFVANAQKIELNGTYQGKNLYIQNPFAEDGKGFCTEKVFVNGKDVYFANSNAYEIKLDSLGYTLGDTILVEIFHKPDCKPKILTQNYIPKGNFDLVSISVDSNAILNWISINEINKLTYTIEQFRWNKWVKVGEVEGKGGIQENEYAFQTKPHSGLNKFRVKQVASGNARISKTAEYVSKNKPVKLISYHISPKGFLEFDKETMYEVYDQEGNIVLKGNGKLINCSKLIKGNYFLNFDNSQTEFIKM